MHVQYVRNASAYTLGRAVVQWEHVHYLKMRGHGACKSSAKVRPLWHVQSPP